MNKHKSCEYVGKRGFAFVCVELVLVVISSKTVVVVLLLLLLCI